MSSSHLSVEKGDFRVIVNSIGSANAHCVASLSQALKTSPENIAACLYQAPRVLFDNLSNTVADEVHRLLNKMGLSASVQSKDTAFSPGKAECDVAIHINKYTQFSEVVSELSEFLGIPADATKKLLLNSPSILLGKVSYATAESIKHRFEPYGASICVANTYQSPYVVLVRNDVAHSNVATRHNDGIREKLHQLCEAQGVSYQKDNFLKGYLASCFAILDYENTQSLWKVVQTLKDDVEIVNAHFLFVDVVIEKVIDKDRFSRIASEYGIPEKVILKMYEMDKFIFKKSVPAHNLDKILGDINTCVDSVSLNAHVLQRFKASADQLQNVNDNMRNLISLITEKSKNDVNKLLEKNILGQDLNYNQAQWLRSEMLKQGLNIKLIQGG